MRHRRGDGIDFRDPDMSLSSKPSDPVAPLRFEALADATRYLDAQGIRYVLAQFVDIHGVAKGKLVPLANLQEWVEQGVAPQAVVASVRGAGNAGGVNNELPADWSPKRTRPLCAYPTVATYKGSGSMEEASNFSCK